MQRDATLNNISQLIPLEIQMKDGWSVLIRSLKLIVVLIVYLF